MVKVKYFIIGIVVLFILIGLFSSDETTSISCSGFQDNDDKITCISNQAITENNPLICEKIIIDNNNKDGKAFCYGWYAYDKNDISICNSLEDLKAECYFAYAYIKNDATICKDISEYDKISQSLNQLYCMYRYTSAKQDPSYCNILDLELIDMCYENYGGLISTN